MTYAVGSPSEMNEVPIAGSFDPDGRPIEARLEHLEWLYHGVVAGTLANCGFEGAGLDWPSFERSMISSGTSHVRLVEPTIPALWVHTYPAGDWTWCRIAFDALFVDAASAAVADIIHSLRDAGGHAVLAADCRGSAESCSQVLRSAGFEVMAEYPNYHIDGDDRLLYVYGQGVSIDA